MSGKQRSYRIRNLEECAAHRKQTVCKMTFCTEKCVGSRKSSSKTLRMDVLPPIPRGICKDVQGKDLRQGGICNWQELKELQWWFFRNGEGCDGDGERREPEKWIGGDFDWQTRGRIA